MRGLEQHGANEYGIELPDLIVEDVHFRRNAHPASALGHKVLARGLSDIAAMGGVPRYAWLSLALPRDISTRWVDEFFRGLFRLAEQTGVTLAGGDTGGACTPEPPRRAWPDAPRRRELDR